MNRKIWLSSPHMGDSEIDFIKEAFETNWIAPLGPHVDNFEKEFAQYVGIKHCAVLSSGTAAIHLALIALGVGREDEVLCSTFTFSASANAILYECATPVFVESEAETWNIDPVWLKSAIEDRIQKGRKPKALILVHLYGMPAQIDEIKAITDFYNIPIIEDAAEALGSKYKGQHVGTFGLMGIFSFNGNKIITTSGGGALVANRADFIQKARFLATQSRDDAPHYEHSHVGYNYRMSNVLAAIGRGQLKVLDQRVKQRRANNTFYRKHLSDVPGVRFLSEPSDDYFSNHWLTCLTIDPEESCGVTREMVRLKLNEHNIEARPLWKPMHLQPVFKDYPYYGDHTSDILFEKGLCLPSGSNLLSEDLERIVSIIRDCFKTK
jgi:dTDP-4-amino-4,6-dideoxygalactose transaminase